MSYTLTLACACRVYVSCHPRTGIAHTRVLEKKSATCRIRRHDVGARLPLWELLPSNVTDAQVTWAETDASLPR